MWIEPLNAEAFVREVGPALAAASADELAEDLSQRWRPAQLCQFLHHSLPDVRKLACLTLGLIGTRSVTACLAEALKDDDPQVHELAESALWSIWFRTGSPPAMRYFKRGLAALEREAAGEAIAWFRHAQHTDPQFAEAYNQCALAHYLLEQWREALEDATAAVERAPLQFGAVAVMGHCYAHLGDFTRAAECYRRVLAINPRMDAVAAALDGIERKLRPSPTGVRHRPRGEAQGPPDADG